MPGSGTPPGQSIVDYINMGYATHQDPQFRGPGVSIGKERDPQEGIKTGNSTPSPPTDQLRGLILLFTVLRLYRELSLREQFELKLVERRRRGP